MHQICSDRFAWSQKTVGRQLFDVAITAEGAGRPGPWYFGQ